MIKEIKTTDPGYGNEKTRAAFQALTEELRKTETPLIFMQAAELKVDWAREEVTAGRYRWIHDARVGDGCRHDGAFYVDYSGCYQCFIDDRHIIHKSTGRGYTKDAGEAVRDMIRRLLDADRNAERARRRRERREEKKLEERQREIERRLSQR